MSSGIYALRHKATGQVYIGSSRDLVSRRGSWWHNLNSRSPQLSTRILDLTTSRHDWEFKVLWEGVAEPDELLRRERAAIDRVRTVAPARCLNVASPTRLDVNYVTANGKTQSLRAWQHETGVPRSTIAFRLGRGWTPEQALGFEGAPYRDRTAEHQIAAVEAAKVLVVDGGKVIPRREAAERIGCSTETLTKRLRRFQSPTGQARVQLSDLIARSEKYRRR